LAKLKIDHMLFANRDILGIGRHGGEVEFEENLTKLKASGANPV